MSGSESGEFSGTARNTSGFGQLKSGKPALSQTKSPLLNQTTQPNTGLFGSTSAAPVFSQGLNASGTYSLFGTSTTTSTSTEGLFGQQNASMKGSTGGGFFDFSNSNTLFQQSKPIGISLAQSSIFGAPQTFTTGTGVFGTSTTGEFSGTAENTSGFGQLKSGKPSTLPVLSQTKTQLLDQTTQSNMELFGSTSAASVIGQNGQTPIVPKLEGLNGSATYSLFGTPTTFASTGGLFGQQHASTKENIGGTFAATSGFGATSADGTTIKFNPVVGTETYESDGITHTINTNYQSITAMKEYETKAFEELRFEYCFANRIVGQQGAVNSGIVECPKSLFNSITINIGLFEANDNKSHVCVISTTPVQGEIMLKMQLFAAPQINVSGSTAPSTFDTQTTGFGQLNQNNLFDQNKPVFGLGPTQTTGFGFGANTSTNSHALFGSKPNHTGFQINISAFGPNNTFEAPSTVQPATDSLFGFNDFNKAPTTSLFNQTIDHSTGGFKNTANPKRKRKRNTRSEENGIFGSSSSWRFDKI